jgi:hypothetical protein
MMMTTPTIGAVRELYFLHENIPKWFSRFHLLRLNHHRDMNNTRSQFSYYCCPAIGLVEVGVIVTVVRHDHLI